MPRTMPNIAESQRKLVRETEERLQLSGSLNGRDVAIEVTSTQKLFVGGEQMPRALLSTRADKEAVVVSINDFAKIEEFLKTHGRSPSPVGIDERIYLHGKGRDARGIDVFGSDWMVFRPGSEAENQLYAMLDDAD